DARRWAGPNHILPVIGRIPVADLRAADLRRLIARLEETLAPKTCHLHLQYVSGMCGYAVKAGYAAANPVRDLQSEDRPSPLRETEPRYLSADEVGRMLEACEEWYRPLLAVMVYGALRVSEARGLRWRDIDLAGATLTVAGQLSRVGQKHVDAKSPA